MAIATHPFETVLFYQNAFFSKSYNPSFDIAKKVIHWHFNLNSVDKGSIRNLLTGEIETFIREGKELLSTNTGEIIDDCPGCIEWAMEKINLQRDLRAWQSRYNFLKDEKKKEAMDSDAWEQASTLFDIWRVHCNHQRSEFSYDRFLEVSTMLEKYKFELCVRAIAGASFEPFQTTRKNGTKKTHDDFELIFRDSAHVEEFCRKAPLPFKLSDYTERTFE